MSLPLEYFLFRNYSVAVKQWLIKNCHLSNYSEEENITVTYTTPERAWSKYIYPVVNGATLSPNINFRLSGIEYAEGENILGFVRDNVNIEGANKIKMLKAPLIYRLTYSVTIYTRIQPEMDVLLYQILSKAHKNAKAVLQVDGQWAELKAENPRDETNLEPGETKDLVNRSGIDITISRAYLPLDYIEGKSVSNMEFDYDV